MGFKEEAEMSEEEKGKCHAIIHTASAASAAVSGATAQIPLADSVLIVPAQMTMIVGLASVFGYKLSEGVAEALFGPLIAEEIGKAAAKTLVGLIPVAGNVVKAVVSASFTEALGWMIAYQFCNGRSRNLEFDDVARGVKRGLKNFNDKK